MYTRITNNNLYVQRKINKDYSRFMIILFFHESFVNVCTCVWLKHSISFQRNFILSEIRYYKYVGIYTERVNNMGYIIVVLVLRCFCFKKKNVHNHRTDDNSSSESFIISFDEKLIAKIASYFCCMLPCFVFNKINCHY